MWIRCSVNLLNHFNVNFLYLMEIIFTVMDNTSLVIQVLKVPYFTLLLVLSFRIKFTHFAIIVVEN